MVRRSARLHRRQVPTVDWRVKEVNWNNNPQDLFRWTGRQSKNAHLWRQLPRCSLITGFPSTKSDQRQLKQRKTFICVPENHSRAAETLDNPQAGITSTSHSPSAKRRSPSSQNNTCRTKFHGNRQHYHLSVAAEHREITSLFSLWRKFWIRWQKTNGNTFRHLGIQSMLAPVGFERMLFWKSIGWKVQTLTKQRTGLSNHHRTFRTKYKGTSLITT